MNRLETISPSLAEKLAHAPEGQRRSLVLTACELAIQRTGLDSEEVDAALASMQERLPITAEQVTKIIALAERLDDRSFALQEEAEKGRASSADYVVPFSQARAASAVAYALKDDSLDSGLEAIYETAMATDSPEETARALETLLA